jgi:site-specific DNA-methyltransferase (adenine-specific)
MNILTENYKLFNGDCLEIMDKLIEDGVKVDCILTDPPYGTVNCKWDSVIPFDKMWERLNKLIKPNGAIVLFGSQPFTSTLINSNIKNYKYDWYWDKGTATGHLNAKKQPMRQIEIISVFYKKQCTYNPQMVKRDKPVYRRARGTTEGDNRTYGKYKAVEINLEYKYPKTLVTHTLPRKQDRVHPTQKPVSLLEYLIKTYTNENELVLDFTMGSGSTGVACINTNRRFIGIELDENYFNISINRIFENYSNK